jgi:hypothetical protein
MKFRLGLPPPIDEVKITPHRFGFDYVNLHVKASALGTLLFMPLAYVIWTQFWSFKQINAIFRLNPLQGFLILLSVLVVHEICHLLAFPRMGISQHTYIGFDPKSVFPYVSYQGLLSRNRYFFALIFPIFVLTVLPFILAFYIPSYVGLFSWVSIFNLIGAAGDILILFSLYRKIPADWYVQGEFYGPLQ